MPFRVHLIVVFCLAGFLASPTFAGQQYGSLALSGSSPLKVYFDVNLGVAKKLETRLMLISKTYEQLVEQGGHPEFIVGFRGKASAFITQGNSHVDPGDLAMKKKIHQWLKTFKARGIRMEQCQIAADFTGIESQDFLPEVEVVSNGYISMLVYQNQGFAQIPMD